MRREGRAYRILAASLVVLLIVPPLAAVSESEAATLGGTDFPPTSWALGVVVPEGAGLQGGGSLRWEEATNVTASVILPDIGGPSGIVYGVMSVMAQGGAVMQAAAGVYPNRTLWLAYSWFIPDIDAIPLRYVWVLNGSLPEMAPGASVSMSIFRTGGAWNVRLLNVGTGASVERTFPPEAGTRLLAGDQEVFAMESYARSPATFEEMGNLTLSGVQVDGAKVVSGTYAYSGWNPAREPVFGVGSAGVSPPGFISLLGGTNGTFEWGYNLGGGALGPWYASSFGATLAIVLLASVALAVVVVVWATRRGKRAGPRRTDES